MAAKSRTPSKVHVLTDRERVFLKAGRARAKASGGRTTVSYTRIFYRVSDAYLRRLARFENAEQAIYRLCSDRTLRGSMIGDARRVKELVAMLDDTFGDLG